MSIGKPEGKSPLNHECFNTYFKLRGEWSFSCFGDFTPVETALVHTGKEAGWASQPVQTPWRGASLTTPRNQYTIPWTSSCYSSHYNGWAIRDIVLF